MSFSIYQLKPQFQQLLQPLMRALVRCRVTPNQITLATMLLSVVYGAALAMQPQRAGLWAGLAGFLLLRMALNAIDGMLANATGQKTRLGTLLNEICDQVSDVALYLPFMLVLHAPLVVLAVAAALLAEFAGVLALSVGAARRFDGPMGKSDRAFWFGLLGLLIAWGAAPLLLHGVLALVIALSAWTVVNRLRQALRASAPATP
ncbi:CDP-alcohol phosphatidyltransferase family protein [Duganella violaceipulchra]|uniref:CDP-alcohol phosphatidyltransferase family protein n=1 Tax=Duganella violaceipulchra TaxID=2849652 RepID=A0AA41L6J5_9BURK|nr:CDP-alcohol phosphatidyltransferase family protein [Duganella violaceicalia]MBV6323367.1 CDP-alcohol phosphatidyltransferase family protein [Duganella violaceicalia]MCP2007679.1 CDP-diacylglycerol--glycerol-3-phosphate 3-phosphatidyltransferase [Duganella violaceicalia]